MSNQLNEQIAALRKERGFTQEHLGQMLGVSAQAVSKWEKGGAPDVDLLPALADALGVTIDALFGREAGERIDIMDTVRRWIATVPKAQRLDQLCRLVWSAVGPATAREPSEIMENNYQDHCEAFTTREGKTVRWLKRTRYLTEEGLVLGVHANDLAFVSIWPEPKAGWGAFLDDNNWYRRLFEILARPCCLELLEYLNQKPALTYRQYTPGAVAKAMGLEPPVVESLMAGLAELSLLRSTELEVEDGLIHSYRLSDEEALVPFLYFARWLLTNGGGFQNFPQRRTPILRGEREDGQKGEAAL